MLTRYKIVKIETKGKLTYPDKTFVLDTLTDDQAAELLRRGSPYIKELSEAALAKKEKAEKENK
jgi:hypothetical protein